VCAGFTIYTRHKIAAMINNAGARGEPIIAVRSAILGYRSISLFTLDNSCARLIEPKDEMAAFLYFSDDGTLYAYGGRDMAPISAARYMFPDPRPEAVDAHNLLQDNEFPLHDDDLVFPGSRRFALSYRNEILTLVDVEDGTMTDIPLPPDITAPRNLREAAETGSLPVVSGNGMFIVLAELVESRGPDDIIREYLISTGEWVELARVDMSESSLISISSNGKVITVPVRSPTSIGDVMFIDGETGNTILVEHDSACASITDKWAVCVSDWSQAGQRIVVYNMEDNWKKYTITPRPRVISRPYHFLVHYLVALYEPPPDGLDGMYENYKPDEQTPAQ
jgi:hypothetical protein